MDAAIVLSLLNIPGVDRMTVKNFYFTSINSNSLDYNEAYEVIHCEAKEDKRIQVPKKEEFREAVEKASLIINGYRSDGIETITFNDSWYPKKLRNCPDAPVLLFAKGNLRVLNNVKQIAIIGTRDVTKKGIQNALLVAHTAVKKGYTVVSGLASGCDTYAHCGCLEVSGDTVAVLPGPVDKVYPPSNEELACSIIEKGGVLISEYHGDAVYHKSRFVERDRIQAGLSDGVIVIETELKGGTMHTVRYAEKYKKKVACLSNDGDSTLFQIQGNLKLIAEKRAEPISSLSDLNLFLERAGQKMESDNNQFEQIAFDLTGKS